jgi:alpha-L-fucosidase 2
MRRHARILVGIDDGLALTHTTNDRGAAVGGVAGPGCVLDHASLGWLAQLYWLYYRYTGDVEFLRVRAWPFLRGVMRTYEAMLTEKDGRLHLPLGISAEYRNFKGHTCGPDPSYQLACIHMLAQALLAAAAILKESPEPTWRVIEQKLPPYTLIGDSHEKRIAVWEGQDLDICHRHHSHLACIYPFDSLGAAAWDDPSVREIVDNSLDNWILKGMGQWSEWCMPWAAIIQARLELNEAPLTILEIWRRLFVNEGLATVYLPKFLGISAHRRADIRKPREQNEIMQLDGTMAAATALYEFMAHTHAGLTRIFAGVPSEWRNVSFKNIRLPGPFLVSAIRKDGVARQVKIFAPQGGAIRVAVAGRSRMQLAGRRQPAALVDLPVTINLRPRETVWLRAL